MLLTAVSWFGLGIWYGWGYCFCTDWHWDTREQLGYQDRSHSYIHFLILKITGIDMNPQLVENATLVVFLVCLVLSIFFNLRSRRRVRRS